MANHQTIEQTRAMCENAGRLGFHPDRLMAVDRRLEAWKDDPDVPSTVVKVLRHGELAFEGAYGILGPGKAPGSLAVDSVFPIFSVTKPVMGVLISILQEEGLLDINDPVRLHMPEFTGDEKSQVRIWHLLTHTSGLIDEDIYKNGRKYIEETLKLTHPADGAPTAEWDDLAMKIREAMGLPPMEPGPKMRSETQWALRLSLPPTHAPQKIMSYFNTGYQMLMEIVTRLSGQSADGFAGEKLFAPLKMADSHFKFPKDKVSRYVTRGPDFDGSEWMNEGVLESESGAGGLKSTAGDMARFVQMVLSGGKLDGVRVLSKSSVRELVSDHNAKMPPSEYEGQFYDSTWGLGWNIRGTKKDDSGSLRGARSFEHGGWGGTGILGDPDTDLAIAYFSVAKSGARKYYDHFVNMIIGAIDD